MKNRSQDADDNIELEFTHETIKRHLANNPHAAVEIARQLLAQLKEQRYQQYELEQKYDELLTSYLDLNDAYLSTLKLVSDRNIIKVGHHIIT